MAAVEKQKEMLKKKDDELVVEDWQAAGNKQDWVFYENIIVEQV